VSPIPKKKKTAEELAALRESLGISSEGPPADAPGVMGQAPEEPALAPELEARFKPMPVPEAKWAPKNLKVPSDQPTEEPEPESPKEAEKERAVVLEAPADLVRSEKPLKLYRKSGSLPVDKPKTVVSRESGKLPTRRRRESERLPLEKPGDSVSTGGGKLPTRKHTDQELVRLRNSTLPGAESPAVQMANQTAGLLLLLAIYGLGVLLMLLAGLGVLAARAPRFDLPFDWLKEAVMLPNFSMILFGAMAGGVAVMLLGSAWIYFKKPNSQHHAGILTIIAVLVLVFGTLYFFPGLHGA
jgi:hypothetical protein